MPTLSDINEDLLTAQDTITDLQTKGEALRVEFDRLTTQFDSLAEKLKYPGTKFLVELEYRLVFDKTITVDHDTFLVSTPVEVLPGYLHAIYAVSAFSPDSNVPTVVTDGPYIKPAGVHNMVTVCLQRQRSDDPPAITVSLRVTNTMDTDVSATVAIRVWRRLGMGS